MDSLREISRQRGERRERAASGANGTPAKRAPNTCLECWFDAASPANAQSSDASGREQCERRVQSLPGPSPGPRVAARMRASRPIRSTPPFLRDGRLELSCPRSSAESGSRLLPAQVGAILYSPEHGGRECAVLRCDREPTQQACTRADPQAKRICPMDRWSAGPDERSVLPRQAIPAKVLIPVLSNCGSNLALSFG